MQTSTGAPRAPAAPPWRPFTHDATPISSLTTMDHDAWSFELERSGFAEQHPDDARVILDGNRQGVDVGFTGDRAPRPDAENLQVDEIDMVKVDAVIAADVAAGKKAGPFDTKPDGMIFISPIGAVPKTGTDKIRVIHHLSHAFRGDSVNGSIHETEKLQLGSFDEAVRGIRAAGPGCLLIKMDVDAAYKQVPVRPQDWPLLGFCWRGNYYYERVLPFGLKSSCRLWEYYARALHHFFEHTLRIPCVVHYVDDFLFVIRPCRDTMAVARQHLTDASGLAARIGVLFSAKKTEGPTTRLTFLGIELDTIEMVARLPQDKLVRLRTLITDWGTKSSATIKEYEQFGGFLHWCCCVIPAGRPFTGRLYKLIAGLKYNRGKPGAGRAQVYAISKDVREDIVWWHTLVSQDACRWTGVAVLPDRSIWRAADEFYTDACLTGYGGHCGTEWFASGWPPDVFAAAMRLQKVAMPFLELYALVCAAHAWGHRYAGKAIIFRTDCEAAMYAVNKGTSSEPDMSHLVRELALAAGRNGFVYRATHVPGVLNQGADILSRHGMCDQYRALCPNANPQPTLHARLRLPTATPLLPSSPPLARPTQPESPHTGWPARR